MLGDGLAIGAAVAWGIFSNVGKRNQIDTWISNYVYVLVSTVLSAMSVALFSSFRVPGATAAACAIWLGVSNIVLSYYLWFSVLKATTAALAASLSFITPFVTLLFIVLVTGEPISPFQFVGLIVILLGVGIQRLRLQGPR